MNVNVRVLSASYPNRLFY